MRKGPHISPGTLKGGRVGGVGILVSKQLDANKETHLILELGKGD
jgi:hypothetical protein